MTRFPLLIQYIVAGTLFLAVNATHLPRFSSVAAQDSTGTSHLNSPQDSTGYGSEFSDENRLTPEELVNIEVYERVNRGVVNITTLTIRPNSFFSLAVPAEGVGSGSVLDKQGHILTNQHVIEGAQRVSVTLHDSNTYRGRLVGQDPANDIAVLKIDAPPETLFPIPLGDSSRLRVGQRIFAVGNPFGLERTLTIGIVSSLNRTLPSRTGRNMKSIIQIDAALNRGNSGGPLINSQSHLIGMNTAIASSTGQNSGVGFAIPVNTVARVVPELIKHGRVIRPDLGITSVYKTDLGLQIATLAEGGPAQQAGLRGFRVIRQKRRRGPFITTDTRIDRRYADLIRAIDDQEVQNVDDLLSVLETKKPGDRVRMTILREGQLAYADVTLGESE